VTIAFDHGLSGIPSGLEDARARARQVIAADPGGIVAAIGLARAIQEDVAASGVGLIGALDATIMDGDLTAGRASVGTVEQFAAVGADCVKILFQLAWKRDRFGAELDTVSAAVREAEAVGLPIMVEPVLYGLEQPETDEAAEQMLMDGCRISCELGASILKMPMLPSEKLQQVVETSYCPVVVLGGATTDTGAFLRDLDVAMATGIRGVAVGRNCWQSPDTTAMVKALNTVVRERDLEQALALVAGPLGAEASAPH
jgi:DhnA family fructose-bisphosphate aldolase class Ia